MRAAFRLQGLRAAACVSGLHTEAAPSPCVAADGGEEGCGSECEEDHDHHHPHHQGHGAHSQEEEYEHEQGDCCVPAAWVRLVSCLHNDRGSHMMSGGGDGGSDQEGSSGSEGEKRAQGLGCLRVPAGFLLSYVLE